MTSQKQKHHHNKHLPVLIDEVVELLAPQKGESYLDLTAGYGGHASKVLEMTRNASAMVLVDRDEHALDTLESFSDAGAQLIHSDFLQVATELKKQDKSFDMILLDLGVSSPQLDNQARGFSFRTEADLDMRMDESQQLTAADIVNNTSHDELVTLLKDYGEVRRPRRVAEAIIASRPISTTTELAEVIKREIPFKGKIHPATRTFQAIRIAVNQELEQLESVLPLLPDLLNEEGRLAIISFHSLEDRLVKRFFKEEEESGYEARLKVLTKKPLYDSTNDVHNPRARSAKLRAAAKIKTKTERSQ